MKNILVFVAHPDDETVLTGGILALLARQGINIHYLCATRGEGGEVGDPPVCERDQLGEIRSQEMLCAVKTLGGASLSFLNYIDPTVGPDNELFPFSDSTETVASQLVDFIERMEIQAVITHGSNGEYGHPGHLLAHQAAVTAVKFLGNSAPLLYTFQANFPNHPKPHLANSADPAHLVLDITPLLEKKIQAALCHRTQHALFVRNTRKRTRQDVSVPEIISSVESLHRAFPHASEQLKDPIAEILLAAGVVKSNN